MHQVDPRELNLALRRLRLLPESAIRDKLESLRSKEQLSPLVVVEQEGQWVLIDGFARQAAAVRLGLETVSVEIVQMTPVQMKAQLYLRNCDRGTVLVDECRLVHELYDADGLCQSDIAALLERHKSWVCRRLALWKTLSPRLVTDGAIAELGAGSLRRLARLPMGNQEELVAVSRREGLGEQATAFLVDLWRRAPDRQTREYLLKEPRTALELARANRLNKSELRFGKQAAKVHKNLVLMRQSALWVIRQVSEGIEDLPAVELAALREACALAERDCPQALRDVLCRLPVAAEESV